MAYNSFPYVNMHELNLDYLLNKSKEVQSNVEAAAGSASAAASSAAAAAGSADASLTYSRNSANSAAASEASAADSAESARIAVAAAGDPVTFTAAAQLTDTSKIYVYVGTTGTYTYGHWYYYSGGSWIDGGIYDKWTTDATLTLAGEAADAKATGDAIRELKGYINNSVDLTSYAWEIGTIISGTESGANNRIRSDFIPVTEGSAINMSGDANCVSCSFYDANKIFVIVNDWTSAITVPSGVSYVRLVLRNAGNPALTESDIPALVARCSLSLTLRQSVYLFDPERMEAEVKHIYDETTVERSASGNYYIRFDVKQGETYIVQNLATTGTFTCYTSNINTTASNIDTVGPVNALASVEFTASQDADFFVGYANSATTIRIANKNAVLYNLQNVVNENADAVKAIGDERVITRSASGNWYVAFEIKSGTKYKVDNLGSNPVACWTSNVTVHNANTDIDVIGEVSGGGSTVFTASGDARYFIGYANGGTTIRIAVYGTAVQTLEDIASATNFLINQDTVEDQQIVQNIQGDGLCFALQSDTHFTITNTANYTNVEKFARLSRYIAMDFIGNLGDIIRGYEYDDYQMTLNDISYVMYDYLLNKDANTPFLPVKGNHDDGSLYVYTQNQNGGTYGLSSLVTDARLFAKMYNQMHQLPAYPANVSNPMYYYVDVKDFRIIVLNSIDIVLSETNGKMNYYGGWNNNSYGYGNAQLNWLAIAALKTDRKVVVFSHVPLLQSLSTDVAANSDVVIGLLNAFINGTSYASSDSTVLSPYADFSYDVSVDYSEQGAGVVIGSFSGHTHVEQAVQKDVSNNILFPHINIKNGTANGKVYTVSNDTITEYDINNFESTRVFQY